MTSDPIRIEGYMLEDILAFPVEEVIAYVEARVPVIVSVGSSEVLCEFHVRGETLVVVLAHIDGGGEGVLRATHRLLANTARGIGCSKLRIIATAVHCADPNPKLRRLLERLSFAVEATDNYGEAYVLVETISAGEH